jgi:hypothetical protein
MTEELYLLGYNAMYSVESQPENSACYLLHAGFLLGLFFYREDGRDVFLRIVH